MNKSLRTQADTIPQVLVGILPQSGVINDIPEKNQVIPKADTHPGTGLNHLTEKVDEVNARTLLGEDG